MIKMPTGSAGKTYLKRSEIRTGVIFAMYFRYSSKIDSQSNGDFKKEINEAKSDFLKLFDDE